MILASFWSALDTFFGSFDTTQRLWRSGLLTTNFVVVYHRGESSRYGFPARRSWTECANHAKTIFYSACAISAGRRYVRGDLLGFS